MVCQCVAEKGVNISTNEMWTALKLDMVPAAEISERLVTYGNIKKPMAIGRLGVLLGQKGYRSVTRGSKQSRIRGWIVYQRDTQEITANKKLLAKEGVTV